MKTSTKKVTKQEIKQIKVWNEINSSLLKYLPVEQTEEVVDNEISITTEENEMNEFELKVRELVEQTSWEEIYLKLTEKSIQSKSGSKMESCIKIYQEMINRTDVRRIDIIKEFMSQQDMSKEGASTYYQNVKKKLSK